MGLRSEKGNALVEFALVLPLMAVLLLGILNFGIAFYNKAIITNASREGARIAIMHPDPLNIDNPYPPLSEIVSVVNNYCNGRLITFGAPATVNVPSPAGCQQTSGSPCTVTVQYQYTFMGLPAIPINASTTMLME